MAKFSYSWKAGWDQALIDLVNIEDIASILYPPKSQPVDLYPVRRIALSGKVIGAGRADHVWLWDVLPKDNFEYILDTYLASLVASAKMTIYTRRHDLDDYARYNCWMERPRPNIDYRYDRRHVFDLRLTFRGLHAAS